MFLVLLLIFLISIVSYAFYFNREEMLLLIPILMVSAIFLNWLDWHYSAIAFIPLGITIIFRKKLNYTRLFLFSIISAILVAFFLLKLYLNYDILILTHAGIFSVVLICFLGILGILENNLKKYLIYSNLIQLIFVFLDLSVAEMTGKISTLGVVQIFNYVIAGTLLFATLGVLTKDGKYRKISEIRGLYYQDRTIGLFAIISAMSLAGVPGLNIFVSEWLLFKASFAINPAITVLGIFAALILFIMYFKIVYVLLAGEPKKQTASPLVLRIYGGILALACVILGILPFTQTYILEKIF